MFFNKHNCRSQWPRGLGRGSAAISLIGLLVGIPPGSWKIVFGSVGIYQVEVFASG